MNDTVLSYLMNFAMHHKINTEFMNLSPDTPPATNTETRRIAMNSNWHDKNAISFQYAHEIGHILTGQRSKSILYFTPLKSGMELEANKYAIDLLLPFYLEDKDKSSINIYDFMDAFSIPSHLEETVSDSIRKLF